MLHPILQQYIPLTEFFSRVLGTDYSISLYDLSKSTPSLVVAFPQSSKINDNILSELINKATETEDIIINQTISSAPNHTLSASCMLIYQSDILLGMLCITFDDVRYRNICQQVFQLCRPNATAMANMKLHTNNAAQQAGNSKTPAVHTELVARDAAIDALHSYGVCASRLSSEERLEIIKALDDAGIFLLKGAVKDVATVLECSSASVYRYLSQIRMDALSI